MQRWERAEDDGRLVKAGSVEVDTEQLIDTGKTSRVTLDRVVCGSQAVSVLVPGRRAWEEELNGNCGHTDVTESAREEGNCAGRAEDEHNQRANERSTVVAETIRDPSQHVEHNVLVGRENVADVGTVEDVLEGRKHTDPDRRSPVAWNEPI